jgi:hypothetical protein
MDPDVSPSRPAALAIPYPSCFQNTVSGETATDEGYFFLPPACLAATACAFWELALLALNCFCEDFF